MLDITVETVQYLFWFYVLANVFFAVLMFDPGADCRWPLCNGRWSPSSLVDGLFIAGLALLTGGLDSILFWLFVGLIVRNAVSVPPGVSQVDFKFCHQPLLRPGGRAGRFSVSSNLDATTLRTLQLMPHEDWGQPFVLRLVVLWLTGDLLLRRAGVAGTAAARDRGGGGICRARRTVAFRRPARRRIRASDQKSARHHQQRRLLAATRPARWQSRRRAADRNHPGGSRARRPRHHADHGLRAIERRPR